ncbi:hypothetical protein ACA910_008559 [Epithemia clementina (nom. ined.)]
MIKVLLVKESSDIPIEPVEGLPTLVYWNTLGLAQSIRFALVSAGVDFCDVRIEAGDPTKKDDYKASWFSVKSTMPLVFPNLPYFLDGNVFLSHTNTILRYIGRKWDRLGSVPEHVSDLVLDELADLEWTIIDHAYYKGPESLLEWFTTNVPVVLSRFQALARTTACGFVTGSPAKPSVADVKLYVFLYKLIVLQSQLGSNDTASILDNDWVKTYMNHVESVPLVADYLTSSNYMKSPMNNPAAKWIG